MSVLDSSEFKNALCALVRTQHTNLGLEVTVPVFYPNGDSVTVIVDKERDNYLVHDASLGSSYLDSHGLRLNPAARARMAELVSMYGCFLDSGRVARRCSSPNLALAAMAVANASRTIGDQAIEIRRSVDADFKEAVLADLREIFGKRIRENQMIKGDSGRSYRLPAIILDKTEARSIMFVSAVANRSSIPNQLTELFDLKNAFYDVSRDAIYDETSDLRDEDKKLMAHVSEIVPFGQIRRTFSRMLND